MIVEGGGMKSAVLETMLTGSHVLRVTDCHLLTAVPGEFNCFPKIIGNGRLEATFPE